MALTNILIIIGIIAGVALGVGTYFLFKKKTKIEDFIEYETVETLTLELVVSFFKNPDVLKMLEEDKSLLAVAIKDNSAKTVVLVCFDKEKNEIVYDKYKGYKYQKLNDDLVQMFGSKDMIVLQ